jgi:hypothetical protein
MMISTFRDFFPDGETTAEIVCLMRGCVVRRLTLDGARVIVDVLDGTAVAVEADTAISYSPWVFDRGSLLFPCAATAPHPAKICTEFDRVRYPSGREESIRHAGGVA